MARQESLTSYAAQRAKILLGCYRTGDANDPETYVAAITAILARYPENVMTSVTHPATGLPSKKSWLPTIKEVADACDDAVEFSVQHEARLKRIKDQMEARERQDRGEKPTLDQLQGRFGKNFGVGEPERLASGFTTGQAAAWGEITKAYSANPTRIASLTQSRTGQTASAEYDAP